MNCQAASGTVRKHLIAERSLRAGVLIKGFVQEEGGKKEGKMEGKEEEGEET